MCMTVYMYSDITNVIGPHESNRQLYRSSRPITKPNLIGPIIGPEAEFNRSSRTPGTAARSAPRSSCIYIYIYIYMYIERERERERDATRACVCVHIYIYMYIERERER